MSNQNQKTWITSDLHLGHANILKYCPWSRDHFSTVEEMNEGIVKNINSKVREDDILIIAGDICFSRPDVGVEFLKRINGFKKIVWGNHDKKLRDSSVFHQSRGMMGVVWEGYYLEFNHNFEGRNNTIIVTHFPFLTWDKMHHGAIALSGHQHSSFENRNVQGPDVRQLDIGCDGNFMMPHDMDDICSEMSRRGIRKEGHHDGTRD